MGFKSFYFLSDLKKSDSYHSLVLTIYRLVLPLLWRLGKWQSFLKRISFDHYTIHLWPGESKKRIYSFKNCTLQPARLKGLASAKCLLFSWLFWMLFFSLCHFPRIANKQPKFPFEQDTVFAIIDYQLEGIPRGGGKLINPWYGVLPFFSLSFYDRVWI